MATYWHVLTSSSCWMCGAETQIAICRIEVDPCYLCVWTVGTDPCLGDGRVHACTACVQGRVAPEYPAIPAPSGHAIPAPGSGPPPKPTSG